MVDMYRTWLVSKLNQRQEQGDGVASAAEGNNKTGTFSEAEARQQNRAQRFGRENTAVRIIALQIRRIA